MRKAPTVLGSVLSVVALTLVAMALPVFAGGGDQVGRHNRSASGRSTSGNGQIVFRRYFDADQTKGALFVMNPDGSEVRQITHPPRAGGTMFRRGLPMERGSPSSASRPTRARAGSWSSTPTPATRAPSCHARGSDACMP